MSRFFFDLHNGDGETIDPEGTEIASREGVAKQSTDILVDVARDEMPAQDRAVITVKVRNEDGKIIAVTSLTFSTEWLD